MTHHRNCLESCRKFRGIVRRSAVSLAVVIVLLVCGFSSQIQGQFALDNFDPNPNGIVRTVITQPDGKVILGGEFTTLSPNGGPAVARNYIARLNPDGTLDTEFNPQANNFVLGLAVQSDGKVLAGGNFSVIGGQTRFSLARLDAVTGVADSFDPNGNFFVQGIAVQNNGMIVVGGAFTSIGGQTRNRLARLDPITGLADSFDPNSNGIVRAIVVQNDGKIVICGEFTNIGGQPRSNIGRVDGATGLADAFNPNANDFVRSIAVQSNGQIVAGGGFTNIGGQPRNSLARLDGVTGLADSFNPNANNAIRAVAVQADGKIVAGGDFSSIGGQPRNTIARLDGVTGLADSFNPNATSTFQTSMRTLAVQADGGIIFGGLFTSLAPEGGPSLTRRYVSRYANQLPSVTLSGRITTPSGQNLRNVAVSLITAQGVRRVATTSSFGVYTFSDVSSGQNYTITVASKRFRFSVRTITISSSMSNLDFVGLE